jgi:putative membrane protein
MQFLKTLFWCLLAFVAAMFTRNNWTTVPVNLWGGLIAEINLPLLLLIVFLCGLLPMLAFHHAVRWRLRGRLATSERTVATLREVIAPVPVVATPVLAEPTPLVVAEAPETRP